MHLCWVCSLVHVYAWPCRSGRRGTGRALATCPAQSCDTASKHLHLRDLGCRFSRLFSRSDMTSIWCSYLDSVLFTFLFIPYRPATSPNPTPLVPRPCDTRQAHHKIRIRECHSTMSDRLSVATRRGMSTRTARSTWTWSMSLTGSSCTSHSIYTETAYIAEIQNGMARHRMGVGISESPQGCAQVYQ